MLTVCGKKQSDTAAIPAGDIGGRGQTGHPPKTGGHPCATPPVWSSWHAPAYPHRQLPDGGARPPRRATRGKVSGALTRLMEEDPAHHLPCGPRKPSSRSSAAWGTQHLEVAVAKLKNTSSAWKSRWKPRAFPYREIHPQKVQGPGPAQEADRRPRPVRRCVDRVRALGLRGAGL